MNQFRVTSNKGVSYLDYAGDLGSLTVLVGNAIEHTMQALLCPLSSIAKVEHETDSLTTVLYDSKGKGYTFDDLIKLSKVKR